MTQHEHNQDQDLKQERWSLLEQVNTLTDKPMIALSFVWLGLLILDFTQGLSPVLQTVSNVIWGLFVLDFLIEIVIAPHKLQYLRRNWLTVISLLLPALRLIRFVRFVRLIRLARAGRSLRLVRVITSLNRGLRAVGKTLGRRGVGYVVALTTVVTFAGAAGMYNFESPQALDEAGIMSSTQAIAEGVGLNGYSEAVWWTAMIMTTMGSEYWPKTVEGRILGWLLAVYAFAIFGYITATIASFFIGQDNAVTQQPAPNNASSNEASALRAELAGVRTQLEVLTIQLQQISPTNSPQPEQERIPHRSS